MEEVRWKMEDVRRHIGWLVALVAVVLLTAGCSGEQDDSSAESADGLSLDVVGQAWTNQTYSVTRSGETLEELRTIGAARLWNFLSIPADDVTALGAASSLWTYDNETKTYTSTTAVNNTLKGGADGTTELTYTAGLVFSAAAGGIHLVNDGTDNCISFKGTLTINNLKAGQTVTVASLVSPGPPMNISNVIGSPAIPASVPPARREETRTVAANGSVTLTFQGPTPVKIYTISVSAATDDGFGLYCSELRISNTQVTWDNVNGKWKIGGDYNTYWRRNQTEELNIYAYAPYNASAYTIPEPGKLTYQADLHSNPSYTTYLSGNNVDLLYASRVAYARNSTEPAVLTFKHALAKMTFGTITNNTGGTLSLSGFTVRGTLYNSATLDLTTGKWTGHVTNAQGSVVVPPPFASATIPPLNDKETIIPTMPSRELSFIPREDGTLPLTVEVNSSVADETFSFDITLEQGKNKTYNISVGKNHEVVIE